MARGSQKTRISRRWLAGIVLSAVLVQPLAAGSAPQGRVATAQAMVPARLDTLPAFIDGVLAQQLIEREVAGAVVTVVHKGKIIFSRGYGHADVDRRTPVDPARTLFRPGSVSKLVTWTALMQQVDLGKVSLDDDINTYLDFAIPAYEGKPILVRHLLDHRPGFEDRGGITVTSPSDYVPLGPWLAKNIPDRVRPPGVESAYSNYGSAIAGYIVERVSGEPFNAYVDKHIFQPLGMTRSSFADPQGARANDRAIGYRYVDGRFVAKPMEYYGNIAPAGSIHAPGDDMAAFMIAQLHDGRYGKVQILKPATARAMRANLSTNAAGQPGFASGYFVYRDARPRLIGHGGNTTDFHSQMVLAPELDLGFFVSFTGGEKSGQARTELVAAMIGRLFPEAPAPRWTGAVSASPAGSYRTNRRTYSVTPDPLADTRVRQAGERGIVTESGRGTNQVYWEQIAPNIYEQVTGTPTGGPYNQVMFFGPADDRKMAIANQPHVLYRLVK